MTNETSQVAEPTTALNTAAKPVEVIQSAPVGTVVYPTSTEMSQKLPGAYDFKSFG